MIFSHSQYEWIWCNDMYYNIIDDIGIMLSFFCALISVRVYYQGHYHACAACVSRYEGESFWDHVSLEAFGLYSSSHRLNPSFHSRSTTRHTSSPKKRHSPLSCLTWSARARQQIPTLCLPKGLGPECQPLDKPEKRQHWPLNWWDVLRARKFTWKFPRVHLSCVKKNPCNGPYPASIFRTVCEVGTIECWYPPEGIPISRAPGYVFLHDFPTFPRSDTSKSHSIPWRFVVKHVRNDASLCGSKSCHFDEDRQAKGLRQKSHETQMLHASASTSIWYLLNSSASTTLGCHSSYNLMLHISGRISWRCFLLCLLSMVNHHQQMGVSKK